MEHVVTVNYSLSSFCFFNFGFMTYSLVISSTLLNAEEISCSVFIPVVWLTLFGYGNDWGVWSPVADANSAGSNSLDHAEWCCRCGSYLCVKQGLLFWTCLDSWFCPRGSSVLLVVSGLQACLVVVGFGMLCCPIGILWKADIELAAVAALMLIFPWDDCCVVSSRSNAAEDLAEVFSWLSSSPGIFRLGSFQLPMRSCFLD
ncbi:hypothetical protein Nepgr_003878 [Nepenthes gracilis]|uniref:Transmembrane protein n=1 Tax=Nepenthes gracilis TaxID=150966 RepID=A0AAD3XEA4_NEPGR|nr:hypothetical protein Nepgr_003878 [Nepenthes gracilis]